MTTRIISNPARVYAYVASLMPMQMVEGMKGLGLEKGGELVAGVLYEGFNPYNVWMHVASHMPGAWLNRRFLWACFYYPFVEVGVKRVGVHVIRARGNRQRCRHGRRGHRDVRDVARQLPIYWRTLWEKSLAPPHRTRV